MTGQTDRLTDQVARATQRLAQLKARQLLREMRSTARKRARERRLSMRQRLGFGDAVISAGCSDWSRAEVTGALLDARERMGGSPTMRLALRKRGEEAIGVNHE